MYLLKGWANILILMFTFQQKGWLYHDHNFWNLMVLKNIAFLKTMMQQISKDSIKNVAFREYNAMKKSHMPPGLAPRPSLPPGLLCHLALSVALASLIQRPYPTSLPKSLTNRAPNSLIGRVSGRANWPPASLTGLRLCHSASSLANWHSGV